MTLPLRVERDGAVTILTFDRPDVLNAFDEALTAGLAAAVADAASDETVRCVVITGAGRAFSAGQDLRDRAAAIAQGADLKLGEELRRRYHPIVITIREMRKPVVAAVNGVAAGAGLGIALSCDVRVASASATFRAAWSKVGLAPDAASAYVLPRLIGWGRAMDVIFSAEPIAADAALQLGLVTRVWPAAEFASAWRAYAHDLANGPTAAYALSKEGLNAAWDHDLRDFLEIEASLQDRAGRSKDYAEGVRAFGEKRPARFTGT